MKKSLHFGFILSVVFLLFLPSISNGQAPSSPCDDGDPNTIDIVDGEGNCIHIAKVCNDGKGTTITLTIPATTECNDIPCDDGDPKTVDIVDINGECHHIQLGCDDGDPTTRDYVDENGNCVNEPIVCDDGDPETEDYIDENGVCHHVKTVYVCDECPDDPNKTEPGECGCGVPDIDSDGDGTPDCNDLCPDGPEPGQPCDDGNPNTLNDRVDANCGCVGELPDPCEDDKDDPFAYCQRELTVILGEGAMASISPEDIDKGSYDECGKVKLAIDKNKFDCDDLGYLTVTLTVTDKAGNSDQCSTKVKVTDPNFECDPCIPDNEKPTAKCEEEISVILGSGAMASITPADIDDGSFDECSDVQLAIDKNKFDCDDLGYLTVTLTVTDKAGNSDQCSTKVKVTDPNFECDPCIPDNEKPVAKCKDITVEIGSNGKVSITAEAVDNGSYDACSEVKLSVDPKHFDCDDLGENRVTLTVRDESGNEDYCRAVVTVTDPNGYCDEPLNDCDPNTLEPCEIQIVWYDCNTIKICIGKYDFSNIRADLGDKGYQDNNTDPKDDNLSGQTYYYDVSRNGIPNGFWIKSSNLCGTCNEDPDNNGAQGGPGEACPKENGAGVYYEIPERPAQCDGKAKSLNILNKQEIKSQGFQIERINIFPNPGSNEVFMTMKGFEKVVHQFSIYNMMGETVRNFSGVPGDEPFNLEAKDLPAGIYYLRVMKPDGQFITKEFMIKR